jgi:hypothetical protein
MGFFGNESSIDDYKIQQTKTRGGEAAGGALESLIKPLREQYLGKFVLKQRKLPSENTHQHPTSTQK